MLRESCWDRRPLVTPGWCQYSAIGMATAASEHHPVREPFRKRGGGTLVTMAMALSWRSIRKSEKIRCGTGPKPQTRETPVRGHWTILSKMVCNFHMNHRAFASSWCSSKPLLEWLQKKVQGESKSLGARPAAGRPAAPRRRGSSRPLRAQPIASSANRGNAGTACSELSEKEKVLSC